MLFFDSPKKPRRGPEEKDVAFIIHGEDLLAAIWESFGTLSGLGRALSSKGKGRMLCLEQLVCRPRTNKESGETCCCQGPGKTPGYVLLCSLWPLARRTLLN